MRSTVGRFVVRIILVGFIFYLTNSQSYSNEVSSFSVKNPVSGGYGLKKVEINKGLLSDLLAIKKEDLLEENSPEIKPVPHPPNIWAVYSTGWVAGHNTLFNRLIKFIDETCINSLVVDVKDDSGTLSYYSEVPLVQTIGAWRQKMDPGKVLGVLKTHGVYPIARVVVFKDPILAEKRPELAVKDKNGGIWRDQKGLAWVDPNSREVWEYNIEIAKEAIKMGFPEIQFDYVRYTSDGRISDCVYPFTQNAVKAEVIKEFLSYAREELEPLGAIVSADIFGLVCSAQGDLGIGQNLEKLADAVNVLSPMVYPSHYYKGSYGLKDPDREPYLTVYQSLTDAQKRLKDSSVKIRPWLQDFSLGSKYGRNEILAQIKAAKDAGINDWLFWNPSARYNRAFYPEKELVFEGVPTFIPPEFSVEETNRETVEEKRKDVTDRTENRQS